MNTTVKETAAALFSSPIPVIIPPRNEEMFPAQKFIARPELEQIPDLLAKPVVPIFPQISRVDRMFEHLFMANGREKIEKPAAKRILRSDILRETCIGQIKPISLVSRMSGQVSTLLSDIHYLVSKQPFDQEGDLLNDRASGNIFFVLDQGFNMHIVLVSYRGGMGWRISAYTSDLVSPGFMFKGWKLFAGPVM